MSVIWKSERDRVGSMSVVFLDVVKSLVDYQLSWIIFL